MRIFDDDKLVSHNFVFDSQIHLKKESLRGAISHCYDTLDMIDKHLVVGGSSKLSSLVEMANLSSIVGNLLAAGIVKSNDGFYCRNKPHTYPDLIASDAGFPGIEIKTALRKNSPKGHLPKAGYYLICRYCLTDENGHCHQNHDLDTVTFWEVKFGYLSESDFCCSNTQRDSGKTATIRISSLNNLPLLYFDPELVPYRHSAQNPYGGYN